MKVQATLVQVNTQNMHALERRAALSLASIFALRMLGLFMFLPVFAIYGATIPGATPSSIGFAIGVYGLTQALLQIPFGIMSDRFGRKVMIVIGLILFSVGGCVAAMAETVPEIIFGRALQGAGAIAGVIMALLADLSREEQRSKLMAIVGMSVGGSFLIALALGPLVTGWIGLSGLFWLMSVMGVLAIGVCVYWVPEAPALIDVKKSLPWSAVLRDGALLRLDFGIFVLHMLLTALFLVIPVKLVGLGLDVVWHSALYLPVLLVSLLLAVPLMIVAERRGMVKQALLFAVFLLLAVTGGLLVIELTVPIIVLLMFVFFVGFNLLEAVLPSLVSKHVTAENKGMAMGVYSTSQFLGAFVGAGIGGLVIEQYGLTLLFLVMLIAAGAWLFVSFFMGVPKVKVSHVVSLVGEYDERLLSVKFMAIQGVDEVTVIANENIAYLTINPDLTSEIELKQAVEII